MGINYNILEQKVDFLDRSINFENLDEGGKIVHKEKKIKWKDTSLSESEKLQLQKLINDFNTLFSDKPGHIRVTSHSINTKEKPPVRTKYFR